MELIFHVILFSIYRVNMPKIVGKIFEKPIITVLWKSLLNFGSVNFFIVV